MMLSPTTLWLMAAVGFFAAEVFGITGVGLMFSGFGALTIGLLLNFGIVDNGATLLQFVIFFAATALWAALLWKPIQKIGLGKGKAGYNNIVGETGYVGSNGINRLHGGEVTWSGTIMKAKLDPHSHSEQLEAGTPVIITDVSGATLIVKQK